MIIDFASRAKVAEEEPSADDLLDECKGRFSEAMVIGYDTEGRMCAIGCHGMTAPELCFLLDRLKLVILTDLADD